MARLFYTVFAEFDDPAVCEEFIDWLRSDHVGKVIAAGALSAEVSRLETERVPGVEVRYRFNNRAAFDRYVEESAPALRAEGVARFPAERGVRMSRRIGTLEYETRPSESGL